MNWQFFGLETDRLNLRLVSLNDAQSLQAIMTEEISKWVAVWPHPLTQDTTTEIIQKVLTGYKEKRTLPLVIVDRSSEKTIGWIKADFDYAERTTAEIGYWLSEDFQGRGLAFEAASALIKTCSEQFKVDAVRAGAQTANEVSHNLLVKLGMQRVGEELVFAPARNREEMCTYFEISR